MCTVQVCVCGHLLCVFVFKRAFVRVCWLVHVCEHLGLGMYVRVRCLCGYTLACTHVYAPFPEQKLLPKREIQVMAQVLLLLLQ